MKTCFTSPERGKYNSLGHRPRNEIPTEYSPERAKQKLDYVSPFQGWYLLNVSILGRCPRLLYFPLSGEAKLKL